MSIQFVSTYALPVLLVLIMMSLGLTLTLADFRRVFAKPKATLLGLIAQMIVLPLAGLAIAHALRLRPEFAVGLMMMAACPPAPTANLFAQLVGGDVALGITLTAVATALAAFTAPLLTAFALGHFAAGDPSFAFPYERLLQIVLLVLGPAAVGMAVNRLRPALARRTERPMRTFALVVLVIIILGALAKEWPTLRDNFAEAGLSVILLNLFALLGATVLPRAFGIPGAQGRTISLILSVHNSSVVLYIAISILNSTLIAVPIAIYSLVMYATAGTFIAVARRRAS